MHRRPLRASRVLVSEGVAFRTRDGGGGSLLPSSVVPTAPSPGVTRAASAASVLTRVLLFVLAAQYGPAAQRGAILASSKTARSDHPSTDPPRDASPHARQKDDGNKGGAAHHWAAILALWSSHCRAKNRRLDADSADSLS